MSRGASHLKPRKRSDHNKGEWRKASPLLDNYRWITAIQDNRFAQAMKGRRFEDFFPARLFKIETAS